MMQKHLTRLPWYGSSRSTVALSAFAKIRKYGDNDFLILLMLSIRQSIVTLEAHTKQKVAYRSLLHQSSDHGNSSPSVCWQIMNVECHYPYSTLAC